jgi:PPOX class probable F420-dependent enzyme
MDDARRLVQLDLGLATLSTVRADGSVQLVVVNAGIVEHPVTGEEVAAFVARGGTHKIEHLRHHPKASLQWRAGWAWVCIEGSVELCGPDDPLPGVDAETLRLLLRKVAMAAGIDHDDWPEYDRVVATERRTVALITPRRIYQNP